MSEEFKKQYAKWKRDALEECQEDTGIVGHTDPEDLEVCENGQIHIPDSNIMTERGFVTPWPESKHFYSDRGVS